MKEQWTGSGVGPNRVFVYEAGMGIGLAYFRKAVQF
jgi:hypothetical protein